MTSPNPNKTCATCVFSESRVVDNGHYFEPVYAKDSQGRVKTSDITGEGIIIDYNHRYRTPLTALVCRRTVEGITVSSDGSDWCGQWQSEGSF